MNVSLAGVECIGYVRVSTDRQAGEQQTSIADQRKAIDALAEKLGRTVQRWYVDDGASGATVEQRPALCSLIADCEASPRRHPAFVLVLNDSRFGRFPDPEEAAYWRQHLTKRGWAVRFAEHDDTADLTVRTVMRAIVASQATQKRNDVRANAKRGSRGTAAQGFWGTRSPYGYHRKVAFPAGRERILLAGQRKASDEKVVLTPHPEESIVVRDLFTRYAAGIDTLATLTQWLRDRAPERHWTPAAVRFTLSNPAYCGDVVSGRVPGDHTERSLVPRRPDSEWVIHRGAHPAIVSRALWLQCQDVLARNRKWTNRVRGGWLLTGLVCCPCGRTLAAAGGTNNKSGRITRSYRCITKAGLAADRCGVPGGIKKEWLEGAVIGELTTFISAPAQQRRLIAHMDAALAERRGVPSSSVQLSSQIAEHTKTRDRLVEAVANGTLIGDEAKDKLNAVRRTIGRLEAQRDAVSVDALGVRALDAERDRVVAIALDFKRATQTLAGPALRETIRPWIQRAVFDPATRALTIDIRHIPASTYGDLNSMPWPTTQSNTPAERTTRRKVVVGAPR